MQTRGHLAPIGQHLRTKAPFLHRLSPDSSVLRASPSSLPTRSPKLQDLILGRDFPCRAVLSLPACRLHYPGETLRAPSGSSPERTGLPRMTGGSALALAISGPAQRSLRAAAHRVAEPDLLRLLSGGLHVDPLPSHHSSVATEASRRLLGRDLPPLENSRLSRRSVISPP